MPTKLKQRFRNWASRRNSESGTITLNQRRIYILPTRQGLFFGFVLVLMLLGDINYNLSLGYVLTFLLATAAAMSMLYAFRNMAQLQVSAGRAEPVFAGGQASFTLHFHNQTGLPRYQLVLHDNAGHRTVVDLPARQNTPVQFLLPAETRGWLACGQLGLYTEFPFGLFHAWSYLQFDTRCLVYPKPAAAAPLPSPSAQDGAGSLTSSGDEDFAGLRNYVAGDAMPRIAWKTLAREQGLQVKKFSATYGNELWLDWALLPQLDGERRLEVLTRQVLDAAAAQLRFGLRLPGKEIPPASGHGQREECLKALALYHRDSNGAPGRPATSTAAHRSLRSRLFSWPGKLGPGKLRLGKLLHGNRQHGPS